MCVLVAPTARTHLRLLLSFLRPQNLNLHELIFCCYENIICACLLYEMYVYSFLLTFFPRAPEFESARRHEPNGSCLPSLAHLACYAEDFVCLLL